MRAGLTALAALPETARLPPGAGAPIDPAPRWGTFVAMLGSAGRYGEMLPLAERYLADVPPPTAADWLGGNPYADAHVALGLAYQALGKPQLARAAFAHGRELYRAVGHLQQVWFAIVAELELMLHYEADRPTEIRRVQAEAVEAQARARGAGAFALPQEQRPSYLVLAGRWGEARQAAEAKAVRPLPLEQGTLGWLYREQGEAARASALVAADLPGGPDTPPGERSHMLSLRTQYLAATLALDAGDLAGARAWLAAHDRWLAWGGAVLGRAEGQLGWAAYHRAGGDPTRARHHAEQALAHASEPRQPLALLAAHRLLGELDTAAGQHAEAHEHLELALALAEACAAPYERALTLLALAELRHAAGERDGAQAALDEARAILTALEARPALARAEALTTQLAAAPAAQSPAPPFGLTAREVEVLRLVALGLSDAQVAERLFVSRPTVKAHLRSIYAKLDVPSRTAAARVATERGLA